MNEEHFQEVMDELKTKYENTKTTISSEKIFQAVQNDRQKEHKKKKWHWPAIAASITALLIGGILIQSIYISSSMNNANQGNNQNAQDMIGDAENTPLDENENVTDEENNLGGPNEKPTDPDPSPIHIDRTEKVTITEWLEGMPEEITYELYVSEKFRFSTYINPQIGSLKEKGNILELSTDYLQMELVLLPPELASVSFVEIENQLKQELIEKGFSEYHDSREKMFAGIEYQGFLLNYSEELISYYAILKNEATSTLYTFQAVMPIIAQEGSFYPAIQRFINELQFY